MLECYREEMNCYANDRGGQRYSQQLIVTETMTDGEKAVIDLSKLGTSSISAQKPAAKFETFSSKENRFLPDRRIRRYRKHAWCANGFTKRHNCNRDGRAGRSVERCSGLVQVDSRSAEDPALFLRRSRRVHHAEHFSDTQSRLGRELDPELRLSARRM